MSQINVVPGSHVAEVPAAGPAQTVMVKASDGPDGLSAPVGLETGGQPWALTDFHGWRACSLAAEPAVDSDKARRSQGPRGPMTLAGLVDASSGARGPTARKKTREAWWMSGGPSLGSATSHSTCRFVGWATADRGHQRRPRNQPSDFNFWLLHYGRARVTSLGSELGTARIPILRLARIHR